MPWNEPGGNGGRDPWGSRRSSGGPPDLDEFVRKIQEKLGGLLGGGRGSPGGAPSNASLVWLLAAILGMFAFIYEISYIVQPAERGVVLRFGAYVATLEPGLSVRFPRPIEYVQKVDIDQIRIVSHRASMLTRDENIVETELAVQYRITSVTDYLFNARDPDTSVQQATETSVREVIGTSTMDFILTEGRGDIESRSKDLIQNIVDSYGTGVVIADVNMQPAKPPEEVKSAFDDAIKAREDEQRLINEAEAYRNEILPKARGAAARQVAEASAYKEQVTKEAEGEAARFLKLLAEYEKAPEVTRDRLYLEAIERVLSNTSKVLVDTDGGANIMYLPLDRLLNRFPTETGRTSSSSDFGGEAPVEEPTPDRSRYRARGSR